MAYQAPLRDMRFLLFDVFEMDVFWSQLPSLRERVDGETAEAILQEAAKLCEGVVAPENRQADEEGCTFNEGEVTTPAGYPQAYQALMQGGWVGLTGKPEYGGSGMPKTLGIQFDEMLQSASVAFALYPLLTAGACLALSAHGSDELKQRYLPPLYEGRWAGTMCLTESHAGTDLGMIRTKAVPQDDGSYHISGTKIFITGGEHDLTENIIHLVLAKLPDAPSGSKGISLFLVPKFHVNEDGSLGERNSLICGAIEHKMGIKGSATCVMNFDGAVGYLVGEPNRGLAAMFTMMNYERLGMGVQGVGAAEMSYQQALAYANDRIQGRAGAGAKNPEAEADPIIVHADVRRMLMTMRANNEAGRCFLNYVAKQLDTEANSDDAEHARRASDFVALLTPIAKGYVTDISFDACVLGQQVFGGHGYIREWGQEQLVRDARIAQIYEGTNGIQALDLMGRKTVAIEGRLFSLFKEEVEGFIADNTASEMQEFITPLTEAITLLSDITNEVIAAAKTDPDAVGAASVAYMHLFGSVVYAYMWNLMARTALSKQQVEANTFYAQKLSSARFFCQQLLPQMHAHAASIRAGSGVVMAVADGYFDPH